MKRIFLAALAAAAMAASLSAHAQATRTWVSGTGDDANPCSRTAPCKTFAGAISKTAAGGEIDALDPGGFGTLTITKSITIDGTYGSGFGGVLNASVAGFNINAASTDVVILRNLSINGAGSGLTGIHILSAKAVHIDHVHISGNSGSNPNGRGISDTRTTSGQLHVTNSVVEANTQSGIVLAPSGGASLQATIDNVRAVGNGNAGLVVLSGTMATATRSTFSGNFGYGVYVEEPAGDAQAILSDSVADNNGVGLYLGAGSPTLVISNMLVTNNGVGIMPSAGGGVFSYGNNKIVGNTSGNSGFSPAIVPISQQ